MMKYLEMYLQFSAISVGIFIGLNHPDSSEPK
jgi:hypothetical protein